LRGAQTPAGGFETPPQTSWPFAAGEWDLFPEPFLRYTGFMPLLQAGDDDNGRRLDRILRKALPGVPLSALHRLLRRGRILVNGRPAGAADRIAAGSVIFVPDAVPGTAAGAEGPPAPAPPPGDDPASPAGMATGTPSSASGRNRWMTGVRGTRPECGRPAAPVRRKLPVHSLRANEPEILVEGQGLLILNKPAGLAVHGPDSLDGQVRAYLEHIRPPSLSFRPGPLHRLDKPSSGIIVFSKNLEGARRFSALLKERRLGKYYLALAEGPLEGPERWEDTLAGKDAEGMSVRAPAGAGKDTVTLVRPLARAEGHTLLLAKIETGRTHQIRVQAALRDHPLTGDRKYGGHGKEFFLHAWALEIPKEELAALGLEDGQGGDRDGAETCYRVTAPPPGPFRRRIRDLFGENTLRKIDNPSRIPSLFAPNENNNPVPSGRGC
jgi:23S rRNA pseudouridine955/2504/2580 synthase